MQSDQPSGNGPAATFTGDAWHDVIAQGGAPPRLRVTLVRSVTGPTAAWFRGTRARHEGRIRAGGVERDVTFVDPGHDPE